MNEDISRVILWSKFEQAEAALCHRISDKRLAIDVMSAIISVGCLADTLTSDDISEMAESVRRAELEL